MRFIAVALLFIPTLVPFAAQAQIMNDNFIFPVVTRTPGAAGTSWVTEICVSNVWPTPLVVGGAFVQGGSIDGGFVELAPFSTYCTQDLVGEWLGKSKWTGSFFLYAPPEYNLNAPSTRFAAIGKVYNNTPSGTYGTSVPVGMYIPAAWSMGTPLDFGIVSGIHNYGTAGVSGFRTSVGVFNPASFPQDIEFAALDSSGNQLWSKREQVPAFTQRQWTVPANVQFENGLGVGVNHGGANDIDFVFAYASVVDNRTGDGVYKSAMVFYDNNLKKGSGEEQEMAQREHVRGFFEDLLSGTPQIRRAGERLSPLTVSD
jgi:hypothetical protein